jgi:hypothetical protein
MGEQKTSARADIMTPRTSGEIQAERQNRAEDKTEVRFKEKRAELAEQAELAAAAEINEEELAIENQAEEAEATYEDWQKYLLAKGDLSPDGQLTIPPAMFMEKHPELNPNHIAEIQRLQKQANAPVRRTQQAGSARSQAQKAYEQAA